MTQTLRPDFDELGMKSYRTSADIENVVTHTQM